MWIDKEEVEGKGLGQQFKMLAHLWILIGSKQWRGGIVQEMWGEKINKKRCWGVWWYKLERTKHFNISSVFGTQRRETSKGEDRSLHWLRSIVAAFWMCCMRDKADWSTPTWRELQFLRQEGIKAYTMISNLLNDWNHSNFATDVRCNMLLCVCTS